MAVGFRNASRTSSSTSSGRPVNLSTSQRFSTTNVRIPASIGMVDVGRLLDRMGVNAPLHRQAELLQMIDLRATGDIETTTTDGDRRKHDRMRQRLHGVVQSETRAAWRSAVDTAGRPGAAAALTAGCRGARPEAVKRIRSRSRRVSRNCDRRDGFTFQLLHTRSADGEHSLESLRVAADGEDVERDIGDETPDDPAEDDVAQHYGGGVDEHWPHHEAVDHLGGSELDC